MKSFFKLVLGGAATYLGFFIAQETIGTLRDPYKKAKMKNKISKIKDTITEK